MLYCNNRIVSLCYKCSFIIAYVKLDWPVSRLHHAHFMRDLKDLKSCYYSQTQSDVKAHVAICVVAIFLTDRKQKYIRGHNT